MKHEVYVARLFDGKVTRASGALAQEKGDVIIKKLQLVLQCKFTTKSRFSLSLSLLDKCCKDANRYGYYAGLFITFSKAVYKDQLVVEDEFMQKFKPKILNDIITLDKNVVEPVSMARLYIDDRNRRWIIVYCGKEILQ